MSRTESSSASSGSAASPTGDIPATGRPTSWRGIDFVTLAVLAVAFGVAFWGWDMFLYPFVIAGLAFPPAQSLTLGVWLLPAVVGGLVVRRPGAALFTELIAANVEMLLGNQWGPGVLVSGVLQGLGVELALAAFRWRRFGVGVVMLAGALAATFELVFYEWWAYQAEFAFEWKLLALVFAVVSGVVVAGIGGWALVRALAGAGALRPFPPGREQLARSAR
ncbi:ECF transporter S component [Piscicoccus intestinalis]|uniref:ECF transporter S component n=1 Tax=Piscicoccus intestinalis TaxID=746033 RepID=UPI000A0237E6|nr:ECF transporter S component [Piscicoccus intestinalis]